MPNQKFKNADKIPWFKTSVYVFYSSEELTFFLARTPHTHKAGSPKQPYVYGPEQVSTAARQVFQQQ